MAFLLRGITGATPGIVGGGGLFSAVGGILKGETKSIGGICSGLTGARGNSLGVFTTGAAANAFSFLSSPVFLILLVAGGGYILMQRAT
jgi:hypothetical protein